MEIKVILMSDCVCKLLCKGFQLHVGEGGFEKWITRTRIPIQIQINQSANVSYL